MLLIPPILCALVAWGVVASVLGQLVLHNNEAGFFPGVIAGCWAAWPFLNKTRMARYNFLHPAPKRYKVPVKLAFQKIRDLLAETSYNYGDRWNVVTADTLKKRISAVLTFADEVVKTSMDGRGNVHIQNDRDKRTLLLEIWLEEAEDSTIIQFDFSTKIKGAAYAACDQIISCLLSDTETLLGTGTKLASPIPAKLTAPPWWLLGLTAYGLFLLTGDVIRVVFH